MQRRPNRKKAVASEEDNDEEPFIVRKANIAPTASVKGPPRPFTLPPLFTAVVTEPSPPLTDYQSEQQSSYYVEDMDGIQERTQLHENLPLSEDSSSEEDEAVQDLESRLMKQGLAFQKRSTASVSGFQDELDGYQDTNSFEIKPFKGILLLIVIYFLHFKFRCPYG